MSTDHRLVRQLSVSTLSKYVSRWTYTPFIGFIDDVNLPEVETYGAQPPIELLRQLVDSGGYYDIKEKTWVNVVDMVMMCAMGLPQRGKLINVLCALLKGKSAK